MWSSSSRPDTAGVGAFATADVILLAALIVFMVLMVAAFAVFTSDRADDKQRPTKGARSRGDQGLRR